MPYSNIKYNIIIDSELSTVKESCKRTQKGVKRTWNLKLFLAVFYLNCNSYLLYNGLTSLLL